MKSRAAIDINDPVVKPRVSRRDFLVSAGAGVLAGALAGCTRTPTSWGGEADIIVVGSGAAAYAAAISSGKRGSRVLMIEKAAVAGGTTAKSGGAWWVPNNSLMRRDGIADSKEDSLKYLVRCAYPTLYNPALPFLGLPQEDYILLETFYENASIVTDELAALRALSATYFRSSNGEMYLDYYAYLPENKAPRGRSLCPVSADGRPIASGAEMIRQLSEAANRLGVVLRLGHRVTQLVLNGRGEVVGVSAAHENEELAFRARKAVIFGSGGFTHDPTLARSFLRGPVFGGCAVPTNTGDFIYIATQAGAQLGNMNNAWWSEIVLEEAVVSSSVARNAFMIRGDSSLLVNRHGHRVVNEKRVYNERTQAHFIWDPVAGEYPNLLLFMIYDQRTADNHGSWYAYPIPPPGTTAPYVISGGSLAELAGNVNARLEKLSHRLPEGVRLTQGFVDRLEDTVRRFNQYAESGVDSEFHRGEIPGDIALGDYPPNSKPNPTMFPLSEKGPYFSIILAAGTLDTKGGPRINDKAQVLSTAGQPISGLYGAGNCTSSPAGQAYWGGGATLGIALTFGYIAGIHASDEIVKDV